MSQPKTNKQPKMLESQLQTIKEGFLNRKSKD